MVVYPATGPSKVCAAVVKTTETIVCGKASRASNEAARAKTPPRR